ncbi:Long-chain-fatty-acid--CoA ligase FadD13 [compost metagenome]
MVGIADELLSETIQAVLVCGSHDRDTGAVMRHCRQALPPHKLPRTVVWKDSLPRTASGKVIKHLLRKEAS